MRLLAPLLLATIGALTGLLLHRMFSSSNRSAPEPSTTQSQLLQSASPSRAMLAGVVGGFALLWLRDLLDIEFGGAIASGLLTMLAGAVIAALPVAWLTRRVS